MAGAGPPGGAAARRTRVTGIDFVYVDPGPDRRSTSTSSARPRRSRSPLGERSAAGHDPHPQRDRRRPAARGAGDRRRLDPGRAAATSCASTTALPGDFSRYRLRIDDHARRPVLQRRRVHASRRTARATSTARRRRTNCPPGPPVDFPIDYTGARLLELPPGAARLRRPALSATGSDRLEADVGVMLAEVMSAARRRARLLPGPGARARRTSRRRRSAAPLRRHARPRRLPDPRRARRDGLARRDRGHDQTAADNIGRRGRLGHVGYGRARSTSRSAAGLAESLRSGKRRTFAVDPSRNTLHAAHLG